MAVSSKWSGRLATRSASRRSIHSAGSTSRSPTGVRGLEATQQRVSPPNQVWSMAWLAQPRSSALRARRPRARRKRMPTTRTPRATAGSRCACAAAPRLQASRWQGRSSPHCWPARRRPHRWPGWWAWSLPPAFGHREPLWRREVELLGVLTASASKRPAPRGPVVVKQHQPGFGMLVAARHRALTKSVKDRSLVS